MSKRVFHSVYVNIYIYIYIYIFANLMFIMKKIFFFI